MSTPACTAGSSCSTATPRGVAAAAPRRHPAARRASMRAAATAEGGNGAGAPQPRPRSLATLLVHSEGLVADPFAASMPPIYQTATFQQPDAIEMGEYDYNRSGNPTRTVLESMLAQMEVGRGTGAEGDGADALLPAALLCCCRKPRLHGS